MPAAMPHTGMARRFFSAYGAVAMSVSFAGHTATHSRQPVHSPERICTSMSTGSDEGQAFAHFAQSMQVLSTRLIRTGLSIEAKPSNAP